MHTKQERPLFNELAGLIAIARRRHERDDIVDLIAIADEIYEALSDPGRRFGALLEIRQELRAEFRQAREDDFRGRQLAFDDFPLIQDRYPTVDGKGYIKRDLMSREDWLANIHELRSKGDKLLEHAKQLEEWGRGRFGGGPPASAVEG